MPVVVLRDTDGDGTPDIADDDDDGDGIPDEQDTTPKKADTLKSEVKEAEKATEGKPVKANQTVMKPVSYTHLDVYKRQMLCRRFGGD